MTLSAASGQDVSFQWTTSDDTTKDAVQATADTDYTAVTTAQTVTIDAGDTTSKIEVQTTEDSIDESDETFVVTLASPTNATLGSPSTDIATITDDDATPTVSVANAAAVTEGHSSSTNMTFTVTLSATSGLDVTVPYTLSGTASKDDDYADPSSKSVKIEAGDTSADIVIAVIGDRVDEANETITVTLGTPTNATVSTTPGAGTASGQITDDDTRGVNVTPTSLTIDEVDNPSTSGDTENVDSYSVVLKSQPTGSVTVTITNPAGSPVTLDKNSLTFTTSNWNVAQTVNVTAVPDNIDNTGNKRSAEITHAVSGADYGSVTVNPVTVDVTDDEGTPTVTLALNPSTINESGATNASTVTARLSHPSSSAVTVTVSVPNSAPVTQTGTTLTIAAGATTSTGTVKLTAVDNNVDAANASVTVSGDVSGGGVADPSDATLTITDDDDAPTTAKLSVSPTSVAEGAGATTVTVTATLDGSSTFAADQTVTVTVGKSGDAAVSGNDYAAVANVEITIVAGASNGEKTFTLTPTPRCAR